MKTKCLILPFLVVVDVVVATVAVVVVDLMVVVDVVVVNVVQLQTFEAGRQARIFSRFFLLFEIRDRVFRENVETKFVSVAFTSSSCNRPL